MAERLSGRQKDLLAQLIEVCRRASEKTLPVQIEEVWGFGSFFRGKRNPRDLDLIVKCSMWTPLYSKFIKLMELARESEHSAPTPKDALRAIMLREDLVNLQPTFLEWIDGYTWTMIDRCYIPEMAYDWSIIARRLLVRGLSHVNIIGIHHERERLGDLKSGFSVLVWSRTSPNVTENVLRSLSQEGVTASLIAEIDAFDRQLAAIELECRVLTVLHDRLSRLSTVKFRVLTDRLREQGDWLLRYAQSLFPEVDAEALKTVVDNINAALPCIIRVDATKSRPPYESMTTTQLQQLAEERRKELRQRTPRTFVLRNVVDSLLDFMTGEVDEGDRAYGLDVWIVFQTLKNTPKKLASEKTIRLILQELGLPESKILAEKSLLSSRTAYLLPEV